MATKNNCTKIMAYHLTTEGNPSIPVQLSESEFNEFILMHSPEKMQKRHYRVSRHKIFNYILKFLYTGCQWKMLPIERDKTGRPEIHYSQVFRVFQAWLKSDTLLKIFEHSVLTLNQQGLLDISVVHGDGTTTMAKKGGDCLGFSGHKHMLSEKVVAFTDRNCNVLSPMVVAPGNHHEGPLLGKAFGFLKDMFKRLGKSLLKEMMSLDSASDSKTNRKRIFNAGMTPNLKENQRNRKKGKRGRKRIYDEKIFDERSRTVERVFAWEDKFKRLLLRFKRISLHPFWIEVISIYDDPS